MSNLYRCFVYFFNFDSIIKVNNSEFNLIISKSIELFNLSNFKLDWTDIDNFITCYNKN